MRDASPQDNPFDNEQSRTFTSMLDQQLSNNLASKGLGLADILAKQLSKNGYPTNNALEEAVMNDPKKSNGSLSSSSSLIINPISSRIINSFDPKQEQDTIPTDSGLSDNGLNNSSFSNLAPINNKPLKLKPISENSTEFQTRMIKHAEEASRATGVPAHLMLGQAALESGWGKRELKAIDGTPSNNLFGIKATGNWNGKVVEATTTEYIHGVKQKRIEKFRAYDSYADSFKDFANMMTNNPRYENVMANLQDVNGYAQAMQKAGYATDPNYATKLASVIQKVST
jgi:flagellar protein FlgJ